MADSRDRYTNSRGTSNDRSRRRPPPAPSAPPPAVSASSTSSPSQQPGPGHYDAGVSFAQRQLSSNVRQLSRDEELARTLQAAEDARFAAESARRRRASNSGGQRQGSNNSGGGGGSSRQQSLRTRQEMAEEVREAEIAASFAASVDPPGGDGGRHGYAAAAVDAPGRDASYRGGQSVPLATVVGQNFAPTGSIQQSQRQQSHRQQPELLAVSVDAAGNIVDPSDPSAVSVLNVDRREFEEQQRIEGDIAARRNNNSSQRDLTRGSSTGGGAVVRGSRLGSDEYFHENGSGGASPRNDLGAVPPPSSSSVNNTARPSSRSRGGGQSSSRPPPSASARAEIDRRRSRLDEIQARSESRLYETQARAEARRILALDGAASSFNTGGGGGGGPPRESAMRESAPIFVPRQQDNGDGDDDEAMAQRMAQELDEEEAVRAMEQQFRDEDLARSLTAREAARASRLGGVPVGPDGGGGAGGRGSGGGGGRRFGRFGSCHRMVSFVITAGLIGVIMFVIFGVVYRTAGGDPDNLPPWFGDAWGDGWEGQGGGGGGGGGSGSDDFQSWKGGNGNGLTLTLVNALSEDWWGDFDSAVQDWDTGGGLSSAAGGGQGGGIRPLVLSTVMNSAGIEGESCKHRRGAIKVCNANYGRTDWTGLNEVIFENGWIVSSKAMMNEFYLRNAGDSERRYVMCHEIGHGFGLPHRDEIVNNVDLGTCMDYTIRPQNNLTPDEVDFENLADLYGDAGGGRRERRQRWGGIRRREEAAAAGGNRRGTREELHPNEEDGPTGDSSGPGDEVLQQHTSSASARPYREGRLLHRSDHGEAYEVDLGGGRTLVTRVLF